MAHIIPDDWKFEIRPVCEDKYLVKVFIHKTSGCEFSEREYLKRTRNERCSA
ncbi:hypothetical protein LCGC14_0345830 [marine sediment metagenome]|uniref:Uncharacterized protein n=1 Tax=marine sediment metagenome TaxID=412755 RepID=A0A0F9VZJ5_9ZZZZ